MAISTATGIINLFLHPPLGLMREEVIPGGPFSGFQSFTRTRPGRGVDAYGVLWRIEDIPPGYGLTPGAGHNLADRELISIAVIHFLLDGTLLTSQEFGSRAVGGFILFEESFPRNIAVQLAPGVTTNLSWLVVLP